MQETGAPGSTGVRVTTLERDAPSRTRRRDVKDNELQELLPPHDIAGNRRRSTSALRRHGDAARQRLRLPQPRRRRRAHARRADRRRRPPATSSSRTCRARPTRPASARPASPPRGSPCSALTDLLGTGHIDVNVDGSVTLTEVAGDLRVGQIRSRASNVAPDRAASASIVDAPTGADDRRTRRRRRRRRRRHQHHAGRPDGRDRQHGELPRDRLVEPGRRRRERAASRPTALERDLRHRDQRRPARRPRRLGGARRLARRRSPARSSTAATTRPSTSRACRSTSTRTAARSATRPGRTISTSTAPTRRPETSGWRPTRAST